MAGIVEAVKTMKVVKMWHFKDLNITMKNIKQEKGPNTTKRPLSQNFVILNRCTAENVKQGWEENTNFNVREIVEVKMELCRVCLGQGSIPIHGNNPVEDLAGAIKTFGGIDISIFDSCPKYICGPCNQLLQGAILFRKKAQSSEQLLKISTSKTSDCNNDPVNTDNTTQQVNLSRSSVTNFGKQNKSEREIDDHFSDSAVDSTGDRPNLLEPQICLKTFQHSNKLHEKGKCVVSSVDSYSQGESPFAVDSNAPKQLLFQVKKEMSLICKQCNVLFDSIQHYKEHQLHRRRHKQRKCLVCKVKNAVRCIQKFNPIMDEIEDMYLCNVCYKKESNTDEKNKIDKTCTNCNIEFDEFEDYKDHKLNTRKHVKKMCTACNATFATRCIMKRHVPFNMRFGYVCDACYSKFAKDTVKKEEISKPSEETPRTLVVQPLKLHDKLVKTNLNNVAKQKTSEISKDEPNSFIVGELKLKCKQCDILFTAHKEYRAHIRTDHQNMKICPICNQKYSIKYFKIHMKSHRAEHEYVCDICGKGFNVFSAFKRHRGIHFNTLPFKCSQCPYASNEKHNLIVHMRSHTGERPYMCDQCPKRFVTTSNLIKHKYTHKKEHNFKCDCGRGFHTKRDLELHVKADHLGVKEHMCQLCGKAFSYRKMMMRHQLRVHKRGKLKGGRKPTYLQVENLKNQEG